MNCGNTASGIVGRSRQELLANCSCLAGIEARARHQSRPAVLRREEEWSGDRRRFNLRIVRLAILLATTTCTPVWAQDLTWSPTAPNSGGNGTWNTANTNWFNGSVIVPWAGGDTATFGGTAGTVTVSGTVAVGGATFNTNGYTITGGTLAIAGSGLTITSASNSIATNIGSTISGSNLTVLGGSVTLSSLGAISYTGSTTVANGAKLTLTAPNLASAIKSTAFFVNGASTLTVAAQNRIDIRGTITFDQVGGGTVDFTGSGAQGGVVMSGPLTITATGGAQNRVISTSGIGLNINGNTTPGSGLTLNTVDASSSLLVSAWLWNAGTVSKTGPGTAILTFASTYIGPTILNGGVLSVSNLANGGVASNIGQSTNAAANLVFDGGTLQYTGTGASTNRQFTLTTNGGGLDASGSGALNLTSTAAVTLSGAGARTLTLSGSSTAANTLNAPLGDSGGPSSLIKAGVGTWVLTGANTYSGQTWIQSGILALSGNGAISSSSRVFADGAFDISGLTGAGTSIQSLGGGGSVLLGAKNLTITNANDTFSGAITGSGNLTIVAGTQTLSGPNNYSGATTVNNAATLRAVSANTFSAASAHNVLAGGALDLAGFSQAVASLDNAGTVNLGGASAGAVLTVAGNYVGNGGTVALNAKLGGDTSPTDRLVVNGGTAGNSVLKVHNVGGGGGQTTEGIKVIDVAGASNGTFALAGDYVFHGQQAVVGGAYAYTLQKNGISTPGDGDWYLRSSLLNPPPEAPAGPLYQPGVPLYQNYARALLELNGLPTLQERVGNRYWRDDLSGSWTDSWIESWADARASADTTAQSGDKMQSPVWGRIEGRHNNMRPRTTVGSTYSSDQLRMQVGIDGLLTENRAGRLIVGFTAQYGTLATNVSSFYGDGRIRANGYSVGSTLTWYGADGFYADGQAQATKYTSNLSSALAGTLTNDNDGFGYAFSLETGRRIGLGNGWSVTPQAQLAYSKVNFSAFADRFAAVVSLNNADSLLGRAGIAANYQRSWRDAEGRLTRADVYGITNLNYEFLNGVSVDVAGTSFANANDRLWGSIGGGGSYSWHGGKYSLYGDVTYNTSLSNIGESNSIKGTGGFRVTW